MNEVITDYEWELFVDENEVSDELIEVISLRIIHKHKLTDRELAIYESDYNDAIEGMIFEKVYDKKYKK